jgi:hypothetical protein
MVFPERQDGNLPVNLDTRQAERQLLLLRERLLGIFQGNEVRNTLASLGAQAVLSFGRGFSQHKTELGNIVAHTLTGAISGALKGIFGGGNLLSGLSGAFRGLMGLGTGGKSSGLLGLASSALSALFGGLFGGKAAREAKKQQEQLKETREFMQRVLSQTDSNDLNSLQRALSQVLRFHSGGGDAFREKRGTAIQLRQAIRDRQAVIAEAIRDFSFQNAALNAELRKFDDIPIQNLDIDRRNQLAELAQERDKAITEFKDSLEVQQQIQQNFELKRQALLKQSSLDLIDTVIAEQNRIRELRAQAAVNEAKVGGNALAQINAELQARLVAIDNDISAFKGAEETKTEFLKAKTAERSALIKQANDQVADLLRDGLDILNEGLVIGETKGQSQKRRLEQLFGTLNPLGLIQSDGRLIQGNVTIGSGAIQMTFEGIQDAQALIAQLSDPIIQAKLLSALNTAIARS